MLLRSLVFAIGIITTLSVGYSLATRVTFRGQQAHISALYCRLLRQDRRLTKPVIFIPGTKGSLLSQAGTSVWIRLSQIIRNTPPFLFQEEEQTVTPTGILTRLALIPGLIEYAPYQRVSAVLACSPHSYFFAYDWRKSPLDNAPLLGELVLRIERETGQKPSLIAHSMGGLVAHTYLKTDATHVDNVVYASVPFQPGIGFLTDLDQGAPTGLNRTLLSKEAVFSHPGSFALLPHAGQHLYKGQDLMDLQTWKKASLSIFRDGPVDEQAFQTTLAKTVAFQRVIDAPTPLLNKFLFIVGTCQRVITEIHADGSIVAVPGDGRVAEASAYPLEKDFLQKEIFVSCEGHDTQFNDTDALDRIFTFLQAD